jgi:hypothetical protein
VERIMSNKHARLDDLKGKEQDAERAAHMPDASEREKADLKLLKQEVTAEKLKVKRPRKKEASASDVDAKLDKALKDSFPGSDPVSFVQAAPIKKDGRKLSTVPDEKTRDKE